MPAEIPHAIKQALSVAPIDPLGEGGPVTVYAGKQMKEWLAGKKPDDDYLKLQEMLTPKDMESMNLYLAVTAYEISRYGNFDKPDIQRSTNEEKAAASIILHNLNDPNNKSEKVVFLNSLKQLHPNKKKSRYLPEKQERITYQDLDKSRKELLKRFQNKLSEKINDLRIKLKGLPAEIRDMLVINNEMEDYAEDIGLSDPPIINFTIGDIDLLTKDIEKSFLRVPEAMGQSGIKAMRIEARTSSLRALMKRARVKDLRYQQLGRGWHGLINYHKEYLNEYGLDGYVYKKLDDGEILDGSLISYGGSNGMEMAYLIARDAIREDIKDPEFNPRVLFSTPGFVVMGKLAEKLGMQAVQMETFPKNDYFYDPNELETFLMDEKNKDIRILDMTPINNPSSRAVSAEKISTVLNVLEKIFQETGRRIVVINDLAYLGMGNEKLHRQTGEALNKYKYRIDVLADTKIIGRPALRCASVLTPSDWLARHYKSNIRTVTPSIAYAMMYEALAIWNFVHKKDRQKMYQLFNWRQQKLLELLKRRSDIFDVENAFITQEDLPEIDNSDKLGPDDLSGLYLLIPIKEGYDALTIAEQTGIFTTDGGTFYMDGAKIPQKFIRLSIGTEPMTDTNIGKIENILDVTNPQGRPENQFVSGHQQVYPSY